MDNVHPKVEEAIDTLNMQDGPTRRRLLKGTGLVSATAAASALLAACSSSSSASPSTSASASAASTVGNFPKTPPWQFWFVNHVYTNPFFVPPSTASRMLPRCSACPCPSGAARHRRPASRRW